MTVDAPLKVNGATTIDAGGGNTAVVGSVNGPFGLTGGVGITSTGFTTGLWGRSTSTSYGDGVVGQSTNGFGINGYTLGEFAGLGGTGRLYGLVARAFACDSQMENCLPSNGTAGMFLTGQGGYLLRGYLFNPDYSYAKSFSVDWQGNGFFAGDVSVSGNAYKPGGGSWSTLSDRRTKMAIQPLTHALDQLLRLHGVTFEYRDAPAVGELPGTHIGMVAQDVEQVFPSWVDVGTDGYRRLTFRGFEAVTVEAVRELAEQVTAQSKDAATRLEDLERQNAELRHQLDVISRTLKALQEK